jgi:hypothetical protein
MVAIAGFVLLATFLVTVISRRAHVGTALVVGTVPTLAVAAANPGALLTPLGLFYLAALWLPFLIAALVGAWLAKLVHAPWRSA